MLDIPKFKKIGKEMYYSFNGVVWVNIKRNKKLMQWQKEQTNV